jgi:acyl-CoA thioesterase-2
MSAENDAPAEELLRLLDLETLGEDRYRGYSPATAGRQVYGGQAIAQALVAATRTAPPDRPVHSLHGYFVLAGDPRTPIDFAVERVRDGKSFTTRRCNATQRGQTIFSLEASFQVVEVGLTHAAAMPAAPDPETLDDVNALVERFRAFMPEPAKRWLEKPRALDMRFVDPEAMLAPQPHPRAEQSIWFRILGPLPESRAIHHALLAYLSDMTLLNTALIAHRRTIFDPQIQVASLDHALWIHRDFRADDWLLYAQESPMASHARALTRGQIFTRDGCLVASVAQEGLIRLRPPKM